MKIDYPSPEEFRAWLMKYAEHEPVGETRYANGCPFYNFLVDSSRIDHNVLGVGSTRMFYFRVNGEILSDHPEWLQKFIEILDGEDFDGEKAYSISHLASRHEAILALDEALKEVGVET